MQTCGKDEKYYVILMEIRLEKLSLEKPRRKRVEQRCWISKVEVDVKRIRS
jgi:hypothetical protein